MKQTCCKKTSWPAERPRKKLEDVVNVGDLTVEICAKDLLLSEVIPVHRKDFLEFSGEVLPVSSL